MGRFHVGDGIDVRITHGREYKVYISYFEMAHFTQFSLVTGF